MKKIFTIAIAAGCFATSNGQALVNNLGANVHITPGAFVIVKTNSIHNLQGTIENGGEFVIEGNVTNDADLTGSPSSPTGYYRVEGDWINNANVVSYLDTVHLSGNNQLITGTSPTNFHTLILTGPANAVKTQTLDAFVNGMLELTDVELALSQNKMIVTNPTAGAITNATAPGSEGFVSGLGNGRLVRRTNSVLPYYYPLGTPSSTGNPFFYRPLEIRPNSGNADSWEAILAKDPSADTYDVNTLDNELCRVNPLYYHRIDGVSSADLKFFFNSAFDLRWTDVAHWSANRWNYTTQPIVSNSGGFSTLEIRGWNDYNPNPFALASRRFTLDAGPVTTVYKGQTASLTPTISTTNIRSYNWSPSTYLDFDNIRNPNSTPDRSITYVLEVTDETGCRITDSVRVLVRGDELLVPSAFSPNNDGMNDVFRTMNSDLTKYRLLIFNRWGEKVFESEDPSDGWDGRFKGFPQDIGVYVYQIEYQTPSSSVLKLLSGNLTLVR